jgi:nucleoside-triphosphatase
LSKKNILITGLPGVGKTTLTKNVWETLKDLRPVGFYTEEIREKGKRTGFELISLDGKREVLSHTDIQTPYRVGKYKVDVKGFEAFLGSVAFLIPSTRLVIIDEIGKMECLSERFKECVIECLNSEKWVLATVALKGGRFIEEVKRRHDIKLFKITQRNRDGLLLDILSEVKLPALKGQCFPGAQRRTECEPR